jgi:lipopolysaccharide transport system permease protein
MLIQNRVSGPQFRGSPVGCQAKSQFVGRNFHLLKELVRRDFASRFAGSVLGAAWGVLQPLSLVILYWFVFTTFMIPRGIGREGELYIDFLITGLIPWIGLNEGIVRSTTSIVENAAMVRRLAFRSELIVIVPNASALIFETIGLLLFIIYLTARGGFPTMIWLLPLALLIQFTIQVGVGLFLAALYVFFRDLPQILTFLLSVVFYLSPILYPVSARFERFFLWNPLTPLLGLFRSAMLASPLPPAGSIVFVLIVASAVFAGGLFFFRKAQPTLADVI